MESLGQYLKKERELRGVTIEEIANITRISSRFLNALENDDFSSLPSEVFVKGFLRAYTKCVGIDPNEVISIYEKIRKTDDKQEVKEDKSLPSKLNNAAIIILTSIIAFVLLITVGGGIIFYKNDSKTIINTDTTELPDLKANIEKQPEAKENTENIEEITSPQTEKTMDIPEQIPLKDQIEDNNVKPIPSVAVENMQKAAEPAEKKQKPLNLVINATETIWLSIVIDDTETKESILQPNEKIVLKAKEKFSLTTGNITGTDVTLDGVKISLPTTRSNVLKNYILTGEHG